ncbi:hypothetical protein BYT27DRAFT_7198908 [Phlegmacium glaucopus]|nr:hypothetical protein BYT27DRAFT_7198908 [Phlegmacium glaucopus]
MDQDSFRRLLQTPRPGGSSTTVGAAQGSRDSLLAKPKTIKSSETTFKPRKLKKQTDSKYRDRAGERRVGEGNDYAHVEAIYEEFEKKTAGSQNKEEVEIQRRYLGGDSEHSILVKGLDHSLLEQNKARAALSTEDVDALEEAFMEATSHTPINVPKKRTREELLRDLKEQRARNTEQGPKTADEEVRLLEEAKQKGKFKPIGFKPIDSISEVKKKKAKRGVDKAERKHKKRKVDNEVLANKAGGKDNSLMPPPPVPTTAQPNPKTPEPEEPINDDFNIFADAGEYEGIDVDDDDDDENVPRVARETEERDESSSSMAPRRWIPGDETEAPRTKPSIPSLSDVTVQSPPSHKVVSDDESGDEQPMRLVPLSSSALPSIKDFLAMDQAAGSYDKKKKGKNKKKAAGDDHNDEGQKQKTVEAKVDRDYKRLKSYTDKKTAVGNK